MKKERKCEFCLQESSKLCLVKMATKIKENEYMVREVELCKECAKAFGLNRAKADVAFWARRKKWEELNERIKKMQFEARNGEDSSGRSGDIH